MIEELLYGGAEAVHTMLGTMGTLAPKNIDSDTNKLPSAVPWGWERPIEAMNMNSPSRRSATTDYQL